LTVFLGSACVKAGCKHVGEIDPWPQIVPVIKNILVIIFDLQLIVPVALSFPKERQVNISPITSFVLKSLTILQMKKVIF
jgi:hypothetical protein